VPPLDETDLTVRLLAAHRTLATHRGSRRHHRGRRDAGEAAVRPAPTRPVQL